MKRHIIPSPSIYGWMHSPRNVKILMCRTCLLEIPHHETQVSIPHTHEAEEVAQAVHLYLLKSYVDAHV